MKDTSPKNKKLLHARLNLYLEKVKSYHEAYAHQNKQAGYQNNSASLMLHCVKHDLIPDYYKNALR